MVIDCRLMILVGVGVFLATGPIAVRKALAVSTDRGAWFFDVNHPVGSGEVVGNHFQENTVIGVMNTWGINRVYNSFAAPVPPPSADAIAAWNAKLDASGITSMLLLSDAGTIADPNFFQQQFIDFNDSRVANEQYKGIKLDLEPQATGSWNPSDTSLAASINRRDMLNDLRDTYADIRAQIDAAGYTSTPIYADLAVFFDNTDGFIGWGEGVGETAEEERDQWFIDINASVDGITDMAFGTPFFNVIESNVNYEINNFGGDVRVALEALVGDGLTFSNKTEFLNMMNQVESYYDNPTNNPSGHSIGIDIQDFAKFFDVVAPEPVTAGLSLLSFGALGVYLFRRNRQWAVS